MRSSCRIPIGHSSGWLFAVTGNDFGFAHSAARASAGTAMELMANTLDRLFDLARSGKVRSGDIEFISLHISDFDDDHAFSNPGVEKALLCIKDELHINSLPIHPNQVNEYKISRLKDLGLPVALENMDRRPNFGRFPEEITAICKRFDCPLVLDLQHAFENSIDRGGNGIELAVEMAKAALQGAGISHLHVSGEVVHGGKQLSNHAGLLNATNRDSILEAVVAIEEMANFTIPIICEGDYLCGLSAANRYDFSEVGLRIEQASAAMHAERELVQARLNEIWGQIQSIDASRVIGA